MTRIAIIGLGYVGLPLALEFAKKGLSVVGYDNNSELIENLLNGRDIKKILDYSNIQIPNNLHLTVNTDELIGCDYLIVTVPTPVDEYNRPDLTPIRLATEMIGRYIKKSSIVIYESTVYPGCTEEYCVPILEKISGLKHNTDFFTGYSPERINPGDKTRKLKDIVKITSGSTDQVAIMVDDLYKKIIEVGTYKAPSIRVAEAAKIIENTQRDINIALINELAVIFRSLDINTREVLKAAGTKWNFHNYQPGLVGGHCIGVDPYYLIYKSQEVGYEPKLLISARTINDSFAIYIAKEIIRLMVNKDIQVKKSRIGILGITFKENCSDIRNSKIFSLVGYLKSWGAEVYLSDPHAIKTEVFKEFNFQINSFDDIKNLDVLIIAVAHNEYLGISPQVIYDKFRKKGGILVDLKSIYQKETFNDYSLEIYQI